MRLKSSKIKEIFLIRVLPLKSGDFYDFQNNSWQICTHVDFLHFCFLLLAGFTGCDWSGGTDGETWECCSSSHPCGIFEGDCDADNDCAGNLVCGSNNCYSSFPWHADCCIQP